MTTFSRARGMGGRYDIGEQGYIENIRNRAPNALIGLPTSGANRCARCKLRKPRKGGRGGFGKPFICAACVGAP